MKETRERQRSARERKQEDGLVPLYCWVPEKDKPSILEWASRLRKEHKDNLNK